MRMGRFPGIMIISNWKHILCTQVILKHNPFGIIELTGEDSYLRHVTVKISCRIVNAVHLGRPDKCEVGYQRRNQG